MINYIKVLIADILLAVNFVLQKKYQQIEGTSASAGILFNIGMGIFGAAAFAIISGFKIDFSPFSIIMATTQVLFVTGYTLISFSILKSGNLVLYTLFLMTGGMILPYVYGVMFLSEDITLLRTLGLILIAAAVVFSNSGIKKPSKLQLFLCCLVFVLNGFTSIISKLHQVEEVYRTVTSTDFTFWVSLIKAIICIPVFFIVKGKKKEPYHPKVKRIIPVLIITAVFSGVSYMLQLVGAKNLPATVVYPLVTGGSIIFSTFAGMVFLKEQPTKRQISGIVICFCGTCLFL